MEFEQLHNGTKIYIDDHIRFGYDALVLADFAVFRSNRFVLDMGAGCGIITLAAIDRKRRGRYVALDINENACALVRRSIEQNELPNVDVLCEDLKHYTSGEKFDIVVCNPPYFALGAGKSNARPAARIARHELSCTMQDIASAAMRNLKQRGSFCFCYRPARLVDALCACRANRLEPKRLRFVKQTVHSAEPWLALIDARLDGGTGLQILPDLIVEAENGAYSAEFAAIAGNSGHSSISGV